MLLLTWMFGYQLYSGTHSEYVYWVIWKLIGQFESCDHEIKMLLHRTHTEY